MAYCRRYQSHQCTYSVRLKLVSVKKQHNHNKKQSKYIKSITNSYSYLVYRSPLVIHV